VATPTTATPAGSPSPPDQPFDTVLRGYERRQVDDVVSRLKSELSQMKDELTDAQRKRRLATEHASRDELIEGLGHLLAGAGNAGLMTPQLRHTLCDHAAGNYRILTTMADELLAAAAQRDLPQLDEKLYLEVFAQPEASTPRRAATRR